MMPKVNLKTFQTTKQPTMNKEQEDYWEQWKICPYPESIFSPLTKREHNRINKLDILSDRLAAHYGRILWKGFVSVADRHINDLQKENVSLQNQNTLLQEDNLAMSKVIAQYKNQDKLNELI